MNTVVAEEHTVWKPLPGSQTLALSCPANVVLYEGTRGPGKTDAQLMRFRTRVGMGYGAFWNGVIFDREYKNLADIVAKSIRWFSGLGDGARFTGGSGSFQWRWPGGETLVFRHIKRQQDYWIYHGHEFPFIGWNELSKYPTSELFDLMMSCNRTSFIPRDHPREDGSLLPDIPLEVFATTNPYGPGHNWIKRRFIDVAPPGRVVRKTTNVFNPRTQRRESVTKTQVRLFGSYKENRYLAPEYIAELENITENNKRRAWLWGDWNIVAGGAFDDVWDDTVHIVPRFKVPSSWRVDRSFDWGSTHPFSVGWWAEADGTEAILPNGKKFAPPRGTLIRIHEWYGSADIGTNTGLKLSAKSIARGIKKREAELRAGQWISGTVHPGPADNQIGERRESSVPSIKTKMEREGVKWNDSDKRPGSRKQGFQLMRDMLEAAKDGEGPGLYFMDHCRAATSLLPTLPRDEDDPDDIDSDSEDHVYDDTRYRVLARKRTTSVSSLRG